jgi:hypothetical protein
VDVAAVRRAVTALRSQAPTATTSHEHRG